MQAKGRGILTTPDLIRGGRICPVWKRWSPAQPVAPACWPYFGQILRLRLRMTGRLHNIFREQVLNPSLLPRQDHAVGGLDVVAAAGQQRGEGGADGP